MPIKGRFSPAMDSQQSWKPRDWVNRGGELLALDPYLAQKFIAQGLRSIPEEPLAYYNLGIGLHQQRRLDAAIRAYRLALALPGCPIKEATNNLAQDLLLNGHWLEGWEHYEQRFQRRPAMHDFFKQHLGPRWPGPIKGAPGQHLVLVAEQGLGDTLQFCRLALVLQELGHSITLFCQTALVSLLQEGSGLGQVVDRLDPPDLVPGSRWVPLMSLTPLLLPDPQQIPYAGGYLRPDPQRVAAWGERLQRRPDRRLIALHWQGNPSHEGSLYSRGRSMAFSDWLGLRNLEGIEFLSIQKGAGSEQLRQDAGLPFVAGQGAFSASMDFRDTAAALAHCDLLLSADSGVVHLAGALGLPAWVALRWIPEWRWGLEGCSSPWYQSLRLFRQPQNNDWARVVAAMASELRHGALKS
ncbi:MAG: glycosyltransferase [Bacteroidetes bacterium]|nr:glycosyltransferase [Bacteroidota bacterium]